MKAYLIYRFDGPQQIRVDSLLRDLGDHWASKIELVDNQTRTGADLARLYDVVDYPALLITLDDGRQLELWQSSWPLLSDIIYYLRSIK